jgi:hypothetical protein
MLSIRELRDRAVIRPVKRAVEDQLFDLPGVVAVDIGEKCRGGRSTGEQGIVVSVPRKRPLSQLAAGAGVPADILGIPTDVIEEEPILHHDHYPGPGPLLRRRHRDASITVLGCRGIAPCRPVLLGRSEVAVPGGYRRIGTLGALVTGHPPTAGALGLTTFDVACMDDAWSVGDQMIDPTTGRVYADLARAALSSRVDAAAVTISGGHRPPRVIASVGPVAGERSAYPGKGVRKNGYGTGITDGVVVSTDTTLRVDHGEALGVRILREQFRIRAVPVNTRFAGPGDSGAALVNSDGRIVALHLGGSRDGTTGFACPIANVLAELDVEPYLEWKPLPV